MSQSVVIRGSSVIRRTLCKLITDQNNSCKICVNGTSVLMRCLATDASTDASKGDTKKSKSKKEEPVEVGRRFFPRRCVMYVPGDDEKKLSKSLTLNPDSLVFDMEDGVAQNRKSEARNSILSFIQNLDTKSGKMEYGVRINSVESGLAEEDLKTVLSGEKVPHTIYLPKVDSVEHIDWFAETLGTHMQKNHKDINLVIYAESAKSLLNLKEICSRTIELSEYHLFHLDAIVFGSDDFCASIGATRSNDASEVLVARQQIVIAAKAFGIEAIDVVYIDYHDLDGLKRQSLDGYNMGFTGKQCIHPSQIEIITASFTPSVDKIQWASQLISEYHEHQKSGKGAFTFRGSMIDKPLLLQAENIVRISERITK